MAIPANAPESTPTTNLSFPPDHYAKLAPLSFLTSTLTSNPSNPTRPNGRNPTQARPPTINTSSLTNTNGSAVIRLGNTSVVCGVRAELLPVAHIHGGLPRELEDWDGPDAVASSLQDARSDADVIAELNLLVPNLELNTGCNPACIPGNAPGTEAQSLTHRVLSLLRIADLVPLRQLLVWEQKAIPEEDDEDMVRRGTATTTTENPNDPETMIEDGGEESSGRKPRFEIRAIWTLYVDILYISLDGSAFSAAWFALLAALRDTRIPKAMWDEDREMVVCDPDKARAVELELRSLPVPLSAAVVPGAESEERRRTWVLHDADDFEEGVAEGEATVVVVRKKDGKARKGAKKTEVRLLRMEAGGRVPETSELKQLVVAAGSRLEEWSEVLRWDR